MEALGKSADEENRRTKTKFNMKKLRLSLKYRPEIFKLILKMRHSLKKKTRLLKEMKLKFQSLENSMKDKNSHVTAQEPIHTKQTDVIESSDEVKTKNFSTQTIEFSDEPINSTETIHSQSKEIVTTNSCTQTILNESKNSSTQTKQSKSRDTAKLCDQKISISPSNIEESKSTSLKKTDTTQTLDSKKSSPKDITHCQDDNAKSLPNEAGDGAVWNVNNNAEGKSIADQVKEAAQSALQQSGMVYVESAGMYYDYKTGYYYNSELGLYYHTDTGCYYYYSEDKKEFAFHSYPDRGALEANASLLAHEKRKARKLRKAGTEEDIEKLTKNLSQVEEPKPKRRKKSKKPVEPSEKEGEKEKDDTEKDGDKKGMEDEIGKEKEEMEDGECSETESEGVSDEESNASTATASDDDSIVKHHPPCMRVIVRDTQLPKLKVGSLFLVTKDGGTIGREGDHHTILLRDQNVSRNHLVIKYDVRRRAYVATDLGSKNGTLLNGAQMSDSQVTSEPMEVVHGSILQLGETKLLCHIHAGNDTCGHCEPGLLMESEDKEKTAYTRTCNVQVQHKLELARLKNKYAPELPMIEDGSYVDRAKARRETVGSSHGSEKTLSADMDTSIAPENKGFKLLEKMGWSKGEGLGKDSQGDTEPIPLVSNENKAGLGMPGSAETPQPHLRKPRVHNKLGEGTLRLAARSKLLQPPAKAFLGDDGDDEEE